MKSLRLLQRSKNLILFFLLSFLVLTGYFGWTSYQIVSTWKSSEGTPSDCIIVLGAAVWNGKPSPAMRERLDVALELFQAGMASQIIVSGGIGQGEKSEAEVMKEYLVQQGVPAQVVHLEDQARSTWENLRFSQRIMEEQAWSTAIIVTHGFHTHRSLKMAEDLGIQASAEPVTLTPLNIVYYTLRECVALAEYSLKKYGLDSGLADVRLNREQAAAE